MHPHFRILILWLLGIVWVTGCSGATPTTDSGGITPETGGATTDTAGAIIDTGNGGEEVSAEVADGSAVTTTLAAWQPITMSKSAVPQPNAISLGETIVHKVAQGEWMMQIARCYGASYGEVLRANPHLFNPNRLMVGDTITVPNAGSTGTIYGGPCVQPVTVQAADSWSSLAQQYQTTPLVMQSANPGPLFVGRRIFAPTTQARAGSLPALTQNLMFILDRDLVIWDTPYGMFEFYSFAGPILDIATNGTGQMILALKVADGDNGATEVVLIDRANGRMAKLGDTPANGLCHDNVSQQVGQGCLLVSPDGRAAAYATRAEDGRISLTALDTAAPEKMATLADVGHADKPNLFILPMLFAGSNPSTFLLTDEVGITEYSYSLAGAGETLYTFSGDISESLGFEPVAWSPQGRYLLGRTLFFEGFGYAVLDRQTKTMLAVPEAGGYVTSGTATWRPDGQLAVISPPTDQTSLGPRFTLYSLVDTAEGFTLNPAGGGQLTPPTSQATSGFAGYNIDAPAVQPKAEQTIMLVQGAPAVRGLWSAPSGTNAGTLQLLNHVPSDEAYFNMGWASDGSGVLVGGFGSVSGPGNILWIAADGSQPFSLTNWLGFKIADFHWIAH